MEKDTTEGQLKFLLNYTENSLRQYFEERLARPVSLVLTENSSCMLSARARDNVLRVRLHRMFLSAENRVLDEIVSFLKNRKSRMCCFHGFVRENRERIPRKPPKTVPLKTLGRFFDLRELFRETNEEYFKGAINAAITWGSRSPRCAVRKRTLGSYSERSNTIRINPILDRKAVPRYYVAFVVYHEMLHAAVGLPLAGKRRVVHSGEFRKRERLFTDYERAMAWEQGRV